VEHLLLRLVEDMVQDQDLVVMNPDIYQVVLVDLVEDLQITPVHHQAQMVVHQVLALVV
jgi:hypothetical protein